MGVLTANDRPGEHAPSLYAETAGPIPERPSLRGPIRAEACVVGGGYAGLSAALHLAERGVQTVLVEAHRAGWGASGRNGGHLGLTPRADIRDYEARVGRDDARKVWELALEANGLVRSLIARHGIDCHLRDGGLEVAWKRADMPDLAAWGEHMARAYGCDGIEVLDAAGIAERLGTTRYHGGVFLREVGHLHPLRYALGLATAAEAAGARLYERSPVVRVAPGRVETAAGAVEAEHVVLAMNGYAEGLVPAVAARAMPLNSFVVATEPLGEARAREIIRDGACVSDTKFVLDYYRMSHDHRLVWGGGEGFGMRFPTDIRAVVGPRITAVFPQLRDVRLTHAWGGTLAITRTRYPSFLDLGGGMLAVSGWSGSGIHMATLGGLIAAEAVAGRRERWDVLSRLPVPPFPGGARLRAPLLTLAMLWYSLRDRL